MGAGRPRKHIDQDQFEKLCGLQCTLEEICSYFDCDHKTLENWCKKTYKKDFSQVFQQKRGKGRISLRRKQYEVALAGNTSMLIWLGKNILGQAEKVEQTQLVDATDNFLEALSGTARADWSDEDGE